MGTLMHTHIFMQRYNSSSSRKCLSGTIGLGTNFPRRYARFAYATRTKLVACLAFFLDPAQQILTSMHYQYGLIRWSSPLSAGRPLILSHCQYTASEQILIVTKQKNSNWMPRCNTQSPWSARFLLAVCEIFFFFKDGEVLTSVSRGSGN